MDELLLLVFLMREEIAVVGFLEEQVLEGIVIFRTYLIGFHHMVVDISLGISEKLVCQSLVGRKLVDFYLTDVPGAVRLNTAYRLLIEQDELRAQGIFQLIFLSILLNKRLLFRPRSEGSFIADHECSLFVFGNESAIVKISFGIGIEICLSILQVDVILHDAVVEVFHYRVVGLVTAIISLESDEVRTVPCYVHILQFLYFGNMSRHLLFLVLCHETGRKEEKHKQIFHIMMMFHIDDAFKRILNEVQK